MKKYEYTEPYADSLVNNPHLTNFPIAWVAAKVTEPIRLIVTVGISYGVSKTLAARTKKVNSGPLSASDKILKREQ
jgi:hypothetical protein